MIFRNEWKSKSSVCFITWGESSTGDIVTTDKVIDLEGIQDTNIKELYISAVPVQREKGCFSLKNEHLLSSLPLSLLNISDSTLSNIEFLRDIKDLRELNLCNNRIIDITPITNLELDRMWISNNHITDISAVGDFYRDIEDIMIDRNPITDYRPLSHFENLKLLDMGFRYDREELISMLAAVRNMKRLRMINMKNAKERIYEWKLEVLIKNVR